MRRLFTTAQAREQGITKAQLQWGEATGRWRQVERGVYAEGPEDPTALDRALAVVLTTEGVASGCLAGVLLGLDVELCEPVVIVGPTQSNRRQGARRRQIAPERVVTVGQFRCTDGLATLLDLAVVLDDTKWEQALESALRKRLVTIPALRASQARPRARARINRVLGQRPAGARPTESLLETLMVQLARTIEGLPAPARQLRIEDEHGEFVARVDLAWPELGLFVELDGEQHKGQPVYDARRETAVVAVTGWLCGRFTWTEVVHYPRATARRLAALVDQARRRASR